MKSLSFKKVSDGQIDIHITIKSVFIFQQLFEGKKIGVRFNKTLKLKFILIFFDSVYPTRPSDTKIQTAIVCW